MKGNSYKYNIQLTYMKDDIEINLDYKNILTMAIDYNYEKKNMPTLLIRVGIDKSIIDHMISNKNNTIILSITKFKESNGIHIRKPVIKSEFFYFLDNNMSFTDDIDYGNKENKENKDIYKIISLGLIQKDIVLNNKTLINTVYKDTHLLDIICDVFKEKNLVIEPFVNNDDVKCLIVPPMETVSKFLTYLDDRYTFYNTPYRFFYDFNKTYLLSSSGRGVPVKNEKYNAIFIYVDNTITDQSKFDGMKEDSELKTYMINVDAAAINISVDKATTISYNQIIGVNSEGEYQSVNINSNLDGDRYKVTRLSNERFDVLDNLKNELESNNIVINIIKGELDSTVFTLNKEYYIKNYNKLADKNGKFLLSAKKEIYIKESEYFNMTTILTLKKCPSTD